MRHANTVRARFASVAVLAVVAALPLCASIPREWRVSRGGAETRSPEDGGLRSEVGNRSPEADRKAGGCRDAENKSVTFGFDAQGRVTAVTNALGRSTRFAYDGRGNVTNRWNAKNEATRYRYDALGRLTNVVHGGVWQAAFTYDPAGNPASARDSDSEVRFGYDGMNRLAVSTQTVHSASFGVRYAYDLNGNRTNIVYPGGLTVSYGYDAENRLAGVSVRHPGGAESFAFGYDGAGRLTSLAYPNGIAAAFGYDAESRLASFNHGGLVNHTVVRDARGFKTGEEILAGLAPAYTNDLAQTRVHNDADQLTAAGAESYTYDENGCLTQASGAVYGWDYENRLVQAGAATYLYDALGVRVGGVGNGTTNYFAVDYGSRLKRPLAEMDARGRVTRCYVWSPGGLLAHYDLNPRTGAVLAVRYYHANEQGSTLALSDGRGVITDRFAYAAYGQLLNRAGVTRTPYRWLGGLAVRTESGGLCHMGNRHYSADMRRFISADPSGLDGGPNLYAYCLGNPLAYVDPLGLGGESVFSVAAREFDKVWNFGVQFATFNPNATPQVQNAMYEVNLNTFGSPMQRLFGAYDTPASQPIMIAPEIISSAWEAGAARVGLPSVGANQASITQPFVGQKVYRVYGGNSAATGASWTPINPAEVNGFRSYGGLPSGGSSGVVNTGQFILEGTLLAPSQIFLSRLALPLDGHAGGLLEYGGNGVVI